MFIKTFSTVTSQGSTGQSRFIPNRIRVAHYGQEILLFVSGSFLGWTWRAELNRKELSRQVESAPIGVVLDEVSAEQEAVLAARQWLGEHYPNIPITVRRASMGRPLSQSREKRRAA